MSESSVRHKLTVLDHGYVEIIETWGSDQRIIESARMSTDKNFRGWGPMVCSECNGNSKELYEGPMVCSECNGNSKELYEGPGSLTSPVYVNVCKKCKGTGQVPGDEKLLRTLWTNGHTSPFEQAGLTLEVQAPILVFREWHRHRTQSYNELSARYTTLPDLYYVPSIARITAAKQSTTNQQGSEEGFTVGQAQVIQGRIEAAYQQARQAYEALLANGVAREVARCVIPVAQYSRMRASANLTNWFRFLGLRLPKTAQWEIRQYAELVAVCVQERFPRSYALFKEKLAV